MSETYKNEVKLSGKISPDSFTYFFVIIQLTFSGRYFPVFHFLSPLEKVTEGG